MNNRYRALVAVTSLALALALTGATPRPMPTCAPVAGLYSARALRRMRSLLQMRLMELRLAQLQRARSAVVHALPVDALLQLPSPAKQLEQEVEAGKLKHLSRRGATNCKVVFPSSSFF